MANSDQGKAHAKKQAELIQDYQRTFESEPGKRVLQDLFRRFGYKVTPAQGDPHTTYFALGQQALVFFIIERMGMNSNQLLERVEALHKQQNQEE
jgi:hypothetical protein